MRILLSYTCPKRKCRHAWDRKDQNVSNDTCPFCGTKNICPVDIEKEA